MLPVRPLSTSTMHITSMKQPEVNDYAKLLSAPPETEELVRLCISGDLRTSSIRALIWRILLRCLPHSKTEWPEVLRRTRGEYTRLKGMHFIDPHHDTITLDPTVHNPLSNEQQNPWKRFFDDGDLRELINKDVLRTFPEMEFFQKDRIRKLISDILLIYAKEHPFLSYRQGMHEILAPLLFILYSDQQTYEHYKETNALNQMSAEDRKILEIVYDEEYFEHDTYGLFVEVMRQVSIWYEEGTPEAEPGPPPPSDPPQPFLRVQDSPPNSRLMQELSNIGQKLADVDFVLYRHLSTLDIPPQLYGIRWLRLLFGREFPLHDLLYIWDVIFSQTEFIRIVHCLFVAMLVHIKPLLLNCDYSGCLQYLMRYPPVVDVISLVQFVMHLRFPSKYPRPKYEGLTNYSHLTVAGTSHPNHVRNGVITIGEEAREHQPPPAAAPPLRQSNSIFRKTTSKKKEEPKSAPGGAKPVRSPNHASPTEQQHKIRTPEEQLAELSEIMREKDRRVMDIARKLQKDSGELARIDGARHIAEHVCELSRQLEHLSSPHPANRNSVLTVREMLDLRRNDGLS